MTPNAWMKILGWTLLHFVWQGALVALLLAAGLRTLRARSAQSRYLASCLALVALAIFPIVTFLWMQRAETPVVGNSAALFTATAATLSLQERLTPFLPVLALGWMVGVSALSLRLLCGYIGVYRLGRRQVQAAPAWLEARCRQMAREMGIRRPAILLLSGLAQAPMAFGLARRVILLPASAIIGLAPQALEAIIAHELAHIRRCDYLVNLLQTALETALFYHPAVWWVSAQIRNERENCCDDMAVALLGDRVAYAKALASLEAWRGGVLSPALAANGGALLQRIRRILGGASPEPLPSRAAAAAALLLLMAALVWQPRALAARKTPAPKPASVSLAPQTNIEPLTAPLETRPVLRKPAAPTAQVAIRHPHKPHAVASPKEPKHGAPALPVGQHAAKTPDAPETPDIPSAWEKEAAQAIEKEQDLDDNDPDVAWLKPMLRKVTAKALKQSVKEMESALAQARKEVERAEREVAVNDSMSKAALKLARKALEFAPKQP